jgi:hypothetical protein
MTIVSLAEAKAHLNITTDFDDGLICGKISAAEGWIAAYVGVELSTLGTVQNKGTDDEFTTYPGLLKEAVLQLVAYLYENREPVLVGSNIAVQPMPFGIVEMLAPYRSFVF